VDFDVRVDNRYIFHYRSGWCLRKENVALVPTNEKANISRQ